MGHDDSKTRLTQIWRDWGLNHGLGLKKAQRAALDALVAGLSDDLFFEDSRVVLRAAQAVLADSEIPGIGKRPLFDMFWRQIEEHWPAVGTRDDVLQLQAMLVAVWPNVFNSIDNSLTLSLFSSPWDLKLFHQVHREWFDTWYQDAFGTHRVVVPQPDDSNLESNKTESLLSELRGRGAMVWKHLEGLEKYQSNSNYSHVGSNHVGIAREVGATFKETLPELLSHLERNVVVSARAKQSGDTELLWWGQARYCHALRKPFRRIADSDTALWWAAREAADRASSLPVEPAASYLQEVLHTLGHDLDESRPLLHWMNSLRATLTNAGDAVAPVSPKLAELADEDALGLAVTWVRMQPGDTLDDLQAGEAVGLPLDRTIDRGQWAAWIFRELLLDRLFAEGGE